MSSAVATLRSRRGVQPLTSAEAYERRVRRRVGLVWALLIVNAITFAPGFPLVVPIPHRIGQVITQGALPLALLVALTVNRRVMVRPNVFLCLVSLLAIEASITMFRLGTSVPYTGLSGSLSSLLALWLLSPWWGRRDLLLVRCHLYCYAVLLGSVLLGLLVHPGAALDGGRLQDVLWPVPGHGGRALRGHCDRPDRGAVARRPRAWASHPGCRRDRRSHPLPHPHEDRRGRHGGGHPRGRREPLDHQGSGAQVLRSHRCRCVDHGHYGGQPAGDLVCARAEQPGTSIPHRADRLLEMVLTCRGTSSRRSSVSACRTGRSMASRSTATGSLRICSRVSSA